MLHYLCNLALERSCYVLYSVFNMLQEQEHIRCQNTRLQLHSLNISQFIEIPSPSIQVLLVHLFKSVFC